ncbi:hypothetical protein TK90_1125 [Thioalkalivibrio sp. K90mix]|jgi:hypothetical protein|uniref:hypothetical protein n=1 Tax=Thioalkalivibrio sp. (strain K90mix) TaxID=396595 RepID=UPI000195A429|nr:hypothetical protein [Thioalkalivibrio sp. K90mix]ADC71636.1 hypothetical protein TK90_1125 [Thioalkalivibrio sp. K90mix]
MIKKISYWIILILAASLVFGFLLEVVNRGTASASSIYDEFYPVIEQINRSVPIVTEPGVRLDGASIDPSIGITYRYTLTGLDGGQVENPQGTRQTMREYSIRESCGHPDIAPALRAGVTFIHTYRDSKGRRFTSITVDQNACRRAGIM